MSAPGFIYDTFISVVVPLRDAASSVENLIREIDRIVAGTFRHWEIVLVDDGSRDNTAEIVERVQRQVKNIQLYCLHPRRGFDIALVAGIDNSIGDFVFTLNPETDPPALIPELWQKAQAGHELVCGLRADRLRRGGPRRWAKRLFYKLFAAATEIDISPAVSDLRLYSRRVVGYITRNNDRHLLLEVLPFFTSHRVAMIQYQPLCPGDGPARRSLLSAVAGGVTILLGSSIRPLRLLTFAALAASSISLLFAVYVVAIALFKRHVVEGWVTLAFPMAVMFFFVSVILGMLSEYIYLLAQQSGNRPLYLVARESTSSVLDIQEKLNVVEAGGAFADKVPPPQSR